MRRDEQREFVRLLTAAAEMYEKHLSPAAVSLYWSALSDLSLEGFREALGRCVQASGFLPRPADLLGAARGSVQDRALLAFQDARRAALSVGAYSGVVFEDRLTAAVIRRLGGWCNFCRNEAPEGVIQRQFVDTYRALEGTPIVDTGKLLGEHEGSARVVPCGYLGRGDETGGRLLGDSGADRAQRAGKGSAVRGVDGAVS